METRQGSPVDHTPSTAEAPPNRQNPPIQKNHRNFCILDVLQDLESPRQI